MSTDPVTLIKRYRVHNYGDTLTDFTVYADDSIKNNVMFQPAMNHYNLYRGAVVEFDVLPIFSPESPPTLGSCPSCLAGLGAGGLSGTINAKGAGVSKSASATFSCPEGEQVRCVTLNNVGILRKVNDWYCTNRPNINLKFDVPAGFESANVKKATLRIDFNPFFGLHELEKHDVDVYLNGHKVGSLSNTIPRGVSEFDLTPSYLAYASAGKADNKIELRTTHLNGGHYAVASNAVIQVCVDNLTLCVCAPSQEEALNRAKQMSVLEPSLSSITVSIAEPAENQEVQKTKTVTISAQVTGDGSSADDLAVTASFSNGDSNVMLSSAGSGAYTGQWTVTNASASPTGECTITVRAATCEASGEATRKVKISAPDALMVEIKKPEDNFVEQKDNEVVISAQVNYYTTSTKELGGVVKHDELDSIEAEVDGSTITLLDTGKGAGTEDDGLYAGIWTPTETKEYTIKVTAKKSELKDGEDEVKGIVSSFLLLTIPASFANVHPYKEYVIALPQSRYENAPVFQRGVEKPQFEVKGLTGVPEGYELRVVIEEPEGRGQYHVVKNLTISDGWTDDKVVGEWDWSDNSGTRGVNSIPIGVYKAQAQLINKTNNKIKIVQQSYTKEFYVIFDWDSTHKDFITNDNAYVFYNYPSYFGYGGVGYKLHMYDERIWKEALKELSNSKTAAFRGIDLTSRARVARALGDMSFITNYISYPSEIDDHWPGRNNLWYDNIKALDEGTGTCTDQSSLSIGMLRAVGIPARITNIQGKGGLGPNYQDQTHSFFEAWYDGDWHWFDPTNYGGEDAGTVGTNEYTQEGTQYRPEGFGLKNNGYWVITSQSVPGNTPPENIYKRYNYNLDVVGLRFDKASYKPGDAMNIEIAVKNTGEITIPSPRLEVKILTESYVGDTTTGSISFYKPFADIDVAASLAPGQQENKTVSGVVPPKKSYTEVYIVAKPYTPWGTKKAYTTSFYRVRIPGMSIAPLYSIEVDGLKQTFQRFNGTFFESNASNETAFIRDSYVWDEVPVAVDLYSELNADRNYSKTIVTIENPDDASHVYTFSMPLYGLGDAAYVPGTGTIASNTTLNAKAGHVIMYNYSSDDDANVSIYAFSEEATILAVELFEHDSVPLVKADACWNITLSPGSSYEFSVYSSTRPANITAPSDDDTCANATPLTLGIASSGAIDPVGDLDWWKVDVPTTDCPQILNVTLDGPEDQDLDLYVYATCDSEYISAPWLYGSHETCFINATPGTYYIKIEGYDNSTGNYTIYTSIAPNADYCCGAMLIPLGYHGCAWIDPAGDRDWWKVEPYGGDLEVNLYGPAGEDFDLYVYDSCTATEPLCAPLEADANETCTIDVDPGTYYIKIEGYGDSTGYYEVWWSEILFSAPPASQSPGGLSVSEHEAASKKLTELKPAAHRVAAAEFNFSEIHATFADEIVTHNDSLLNLEVSAPESVRVGESVPITVTVGNGGVVKETMDLTLNVSKTARYSYTPEIIYTNTTTVSVSPNSAKNVTYSVDIPTDTEIGVWNINVDTDKGIGAEAAFTVADAFDLTCTQNLTVLQDSIFVFNATVTNTWDTAVHDVNVSVELYYSFNTSEPVEKQLGTLLLNETRAVSWQLTATSSGELPIEVLATSDDGGSDTVSTSVTALSPPILWIPTVINRTSAPDPGTNKTIFLNLTVQNWGDLPAQNVQVQLILPAHATSTVVTHALGTLSAGEQKNISVDLTYGTQKDFAFEVVANDDANHTATSTIMISQSGLYEDTLDTGSGGYPSIAGIHTGVIKPSHEINVSTLYTYPCPGTGGHTEYVWIHGAGVNASATWNGYQDGYQSLEFPEPFTLHEGVTYYYTIRTGSYPQIIHKQTHPTLDDSFINCTTFTDVNGRVYTDWIPAIRLY
ncbi:MAG: hypothetical protein JW878_10075 [Methanomicrobia archaeon]|nr:hypothetical protein [Methanomicrobia archaeon]